MPFGTRLFLIAVMALTAIVGWIALRPLIPKLRRFTSSHKSQVDITFSIICILWGSGVWYLIVVKSAYSNVFAVVMASVLVCVGIYSLARRFVRKV
jgi:hypothetical protein